MFIAVTNNHINRGGYHSAVLLPWSSIPGLFNTGRVPVDKSDPFGGPHAPHMDVTA